MRETYLFQVFVNEQGKFGNPGSLIIDEANQLSPDKRTYITAEIGHDETLFVNDMDNCDVSIYHSQGEVDFAGSVLVGAVWQLSQIKEESVLNIHCKRGDIKTWQSDGISWLRIGLEGNLGQWDYEKLDSPQVVDDIKVEDTVGWKKMVWAWIDEDKRLVRARTFASKIDIPEVQGNGSGSMNLAGQVQREIKIIHGDGSVIYARPAANNSAELGGRVIAIK
jgi:predicted PhzF superfamily epimerase YddE/YHI9